MEKRTLGLYRRAQQGSSTRRACFQRFYIWFGQNIEDVILFNGLTIQGGGQEAQDQGCSSYELWAAQEGQTYTQVVKFQGNMMNSDFSEAVARKLGVNHNISEW